jgi:Domain of unknown function (DUF4468) with TBP-like fold
MKRFTFLFAFCFISAIGFTQEFIISLETNKVLIKEVIVFDSIKADNLYSTAKEWFAKTYVSSKDVIQLDDKESKKIIGKGSKQINTTVFGYYDVIMQYTITISVKDYKIKIEMTDLTYSSPLAGYYTYYAESRISDKNIDTGTKKDIKLNHELKQQTINSYLELRESLKNSIKFSASNKNW